jgi:hypothetical protein
MDHRGHELGEKERFDPLRGLEVHRDDSGGGLELLVSFLVHGLILGDLKQFERGQFVLGQVGDQRRDAVGRRGLSDSRRVDGHHRLVDRGRRAGALGILARSSRSGLLVLASLATGEVDVDPLAALRVVEDFVDGVLDLLAGLEAATPDLRAQLVQLEPRLLNDRGSRPLRNADKNRDKVRGMRLTRMRT